MSQLTVNPGWRSSEFWLTAVPSAVLVVLDCVSGSGVLVPVWMAPVLVGVYTVCRTILKLKQPKI